MLFGSTLAYLILWGLIATVAMTTVLQASLGLGFSRMSLPFLVGAFFSADRQRALAELERFGPNAVAGVKARLARTPTLEVRKRLLLFLDKYDGPNPYHLRCVRGVATLEAIGTADARALLAQLAKGPADDLLTREARAVTRRGGSR